MVTSLIQDQGNNQKVSLRLGVQFDEAILFNIKEKHIK